MARATLKQICRLIDTVTDTLPIEQQFLDDLKKSIEIDNKNHSRKPSQTYKPSSMNCLRNMYYQVTGAESSCDDPTYSTIGICNSGSDIHIRVQQAVTSMKECGYDCEYIDVADFVTSRDLDYLNIVDKSGMETKLYHKDLNMSFLCDGIIRYKSHYYILELKTETSYKWNSRKGVDSKHYNQATAYSIAFKLPEIIFVYICRDTLDMKAYMYVPTDEQKQDLIGKIDECDKCVKEHKVPDKPIELPKNLCNYCAYKHLCESEKL